MPSEFDLNLSEFSEELDAIAEMAAAPRRGNGKSTTPRSRIAAGNGATLLLAATFEEYVRQQVQAAFRAKMGASTTINDFPARIASTVWKQSLALLARTPFREIEADALTADARVNATLAFCLRKEITADVSQAIAHNENNMRPDELNGLFKRLGFSNIILEACRDRTLIDFLGADSADRACALLRTRMEEFYRRRNEVAHAIRLRRSSGPAELQQDIDLFRRFGEALAAAVDKQLTLENAKKAEGVPQLTF